MLQLVYYPDPRLRTPSEEITVFDVGLKDLAAAMNETMNAENGIGLAAPQIGKNIRLIIVKEGEEGTAYRAYVNPVVTLASKKKTAIEEGCLSIPGILGFVERSAKIHVRYQDIEGVWRVEKASGMQAIVLQHEIDHVNGILILDRPIQITKGAELLERSLHDEKK